MPDNGLWAYNANLSGLTKPGFNSAGIDTDATTAYGRDWFVNIYHRDSTETMRRDTIIVDCTVEEAREIAELASSIGESVKRLRGLMAKGSPTNAEEPAK